MLLPLPANSVARQIIQDLTDKKILYAISHDGFFRSVNGGSSWQNIGSSSLPKIKFNCITTHISRTKTIFLATDTTINVSCDRGSSWESIGAGLPNCTIMQVFTNEDYLYAVTFGRGILESIIKKVIIIRKANTS
jgi:hypothetical protein